MPVVFYISLSAENTIACFRLEPGTGRLTFTGVSPIQGGPAALAVGPDRSVLYAGLRSNPGIAAFRIEPGTGALVLLGTVPLESDPCFLAADRTGQFLLSSYYQAGRVAVHPIEQDGRVGASPVEGFHTAQNAHCIQTDPSNRFAFVPHTGPNAIWQFCFDERTGKLTPNSAPRVSPPEGTEPRHFCFHPQKDIAYVVNEKGSSVTVYGFSAGSGTLSELQTISTLPGDFAGANACAQIRITPSGGSLYASNRGHDSIACFAVHESSGKLRSLGQVATEKHPRAFNLDPDGRFLYAAGRDSGKLAAYRVDESSGRLEGGEITTVGKQPMWVLGLRV